MSRTPLRLLRDTEARFASYTGVSGEPGYATDTKRLRVMDGETPGGVVMARAGRNSDITELTGLTDLGVGGRLTGRTFGYDRVLQLPDATNLDTVTQSGGYDVSGALNGPPGAPQWLYVEVFKHSGFSSGSKFMLQKAYGLTGDSAPAVRVQINGTWQPWRKLWSQIDLDPGIFDRRRDVTFYDADPSGKTDATAAFNRALAEQGVVVVPEVGNFRINGRVGALSGQVSPQILARYAGKSRVTLGPGGGFDLSGRGSRLMGLVVVPDGVVAAAIRTGSGDNTGTIIDKNMFMANMAASSGSYFGCLLDAFNFWYSSFVGNACVNGVFFNDYRGIGLRFRYSTNVKVSGNLLSCFDDAYLWDVDTTSGSNRYCEGHTIDGNIFIVNRRNAFFQGGTCALLSANIIDLTKPDGIVLESTAHETALMNNWLAAQAGGEASTLIHDCHRFKAMGNGWQGNDGTGVHLYLINAQKPTIIANAFDTRGAACIAQGTTNDVDFSHNDMADQSYFAVDLTPVSRLVYDGNRAHGQEEKLPAGMPTRRPMWATSVVVQSSATPSVVQSFPITVPSNRFAKQPLYHVTLGNDAVVPLQASIDYDNSTATKAVVTVRRTDGQNIPAGTGMRLNVSGIGTE